MLGMPSRELRHCCDEVVQEVVLPRIEHPASPKNERGIGVVGFLPYNSFNPFRIATIFWRPNTWNQGGIYFGSSEERDSLLRKCGFPGALRQDAVVRDLDGVEVCFRCQRSRHGRILHCAHRNAVSLLLEEMSRHPSKGQAGFFATWLAAATFVGTCTRLARRDFDVGVKLLGYAWVLASPRDQRCHRHGLSKSQGHNGSSKFTNVAVGKQKNRDFVEIFTFF